MRFVNTEDLAAMGLSEDEAFARGAKNTAAELGPPEGRLAREQDGFQVYTGHAYASSLLLPASAWAKVAGRTKGGLLMIAPKPDLLFVMDAATPDAEGMMARVAAVAAADAPGRMSTLVYRWSSGGWQPFLRGPQSL
ncbi:MAG: hypothetical protein H6730_09185 [Deltaproteobacteria bacterium]|nr:hypothetical protein [Deltaproteobacteria bacterium]